MFKLHKDIKKTQWLEYWKVIVRDIGEVGFSNTQTYISRHPSTGTGTLATALRKTSFYAVTALEGVVQVDEFALLIAITHQAMKRLLDKCVCLKLPLLQSEIQKRVPGAYGNITNLCEYV